LPRRFARHRVPHAPRSARSKDDRYGTKAVYPVVPYEDIDLGSVMQVTAAATNEVITRYASTSDQTDLEQAERLLQEDPQNVALLEWVAFLNYTSGNFPRAVEQYRKLIDLDSRNEGYYYYLGNLYLKIRDVAHAVDLWRQAVAVGPLSKFGAKARQLLQMYA